MIGGSSASHEHLSLLISDPFHPVTAPTMASLRGGCRECRVVGVDAAAGAEPSPPGVDVVLSVPAPECEGFAEAVRDVAVGHRLNAVLPWTDRDARGLARHRAVLERVGVAVVCPPAALVELAGDKWATVQRLRDLGVGVPETRIVRSGEELRECARDLGYPGRRLILKPRHLAGGAGVWRLRAGSDPMAAGSWPCLPVAALAAALDERDETSTPVADLGQARAASGQARGDAVGGFVLQHEIDGVDVSVDVLALDGRRLAAVARTREATLGGLSVAGRVGAPSGPMLLAVEAIVAGLSWSSLANIQLIASAEGPVTAYEINARASGSIGLDSYAGMDLLSAAIHLARTGQPPAGLDRVVARPVRFRRHWLDQSWAPEDIRSADAAAVGLR